MTRRNTVNNLIAEKAIHSPMSSVMLMKRHGKLGSNLAPALRVGRGSAQYKHRRAKGTAEVSRFIVNCYSISSRNWLPSSAQGIVITFELDVVISITTDSIS